MARKSSSTVAYAPEEENLLIFDEDGDYAGTNSAPIEDVQAQVKVAQEELLQLRMRQEEIERQQLHLEEIRKKQASFAAGKRELLDKLTRSASTIERDLYNNQKLTEELTATLDVFQRHVEVLRSLQPDKWQRNQTDEELNGALQAIEDAEEDYTKSSRRLENLRPAESERRSPGSSKMEAIGEDPVLWFKRGLAFTLPLIITAIIGLVIARLLF
jgi:chromosome segregation ATPase